MEYTREELNEKGVYAIINLVNGKRYIGSTAGCFRERWGKHQQHLKRNIHHSNYLQNSWNKYGKDSFKFKILETLRDDLIGEWLLKREQWHIDLFGTACREYGYNISPTAGSPLGCIRSEEFKQKLSNIKLGKKLSVEHRQKIIDGLIGRKHSLETRQKMSISQKGKKISEAVIEARCKNIYTFLNPNGEKVEIKNLKKFCKENNLSSPHMYQVYTGKRNVHKNWVKYFEDINQVYVPKQTKLYTFLSPENVEVTPNNLDKLCTENNLSNASMYKLIKGKQKIYKGWTYVKTTIM